jgi:uncharacterized protein YndB with AHSA1/START domain
VPAKQLVVERVFAASPERVFDAFTDPVQLKAWWWPGGITCPSAEVDLRVGGTYRIEMAWPDHVPDSAQVTHALKGEYYEIDRPYKLVMSGRGVHNQLGEIFATLIELTFATCSAGTKLTMRQAYFEPLPPPEALAGAEQGWSEQLDQLGRHLTGSRSRRSGTTREETA